MQKAAYFDDHWGDGWPALETIEACLTGRALRAQFFARGQDGGSFFVECSSGNGKIALYMHMHPDYGVKLQYPKPNDDLSGVLTYHSKGDVRRLREFVRSMHDTPLSIGLFVPFEPGWRAIEEFIRTDGELPTAISWLADDDLPPEIFPLP